MQLELSLYASGLKNVADSFKDTSDPFAVVTKLATTQGSKPEVLGKTEVIRNSLNPQWTTVFKLDYELGTPVSVCVSIFDDGNESEDNSMGIAVFDVGELLGSPGLTKAKRLSQGILVANVRKSTGSGIFRLKIKGIDLKNVEGPFRKSDPFFELSRQINAAGNRIWDNVYRSETIQSNLSPEWEEATVELSILCGGNLDEPILVTLYDDESDGKHESMGQLETTVNALVAAASSGSELVVTNRGKECGSVAILIAQVLNSDAVSEPAANITMPVDVKSATRPSFMDYLSGGCKLKVVVAIDFTGSNGDPCKPGTLHYMDAHSKNDYEKAISSVLTILQKYDDEKMFPVLGFGAKFDGVINHCFQVGPAEFSHGIQGVLDSYNRVFESGLTLSTPTVFTEVLKDAAGRAQRSLEESRNNGHLSYTILLIVTDGAVSDVEHTAACLREVSSSPLSVVIVGVGNEDFSAMQFLDDLKGHRDMVQFVEFNKHSHSSIDLTSATLKEIPNQLVECFQSMGYQPMPAVAVKESEIAVEDEENTIDLSLNFKDDEIVVVRGGMDKNRYEF